MRIQIIVASSLFIFGCTGVHAKGNAKSAAVAPASFSGHWEKIKDPSCRITLNQMGEKLKGNYSTSPRADGKIVQVGHIEGTITKVGHAHVTYTSGFANKGSKGSVDLDLTSEGLKWTLIKPPVQDFGEDYSPQTVVMKRL